MSTTPAGREIAPEALTVDDLVNMGERAVTARLPKELLLTATRLYVHERVRARQRAHALSSERRAYRLAVGDPHDTLDLLINKAAMEAAAALTFEWSPLLDVPFLVPTHDVITTWGAAEVAQHVDRAQWLEQHSAGALRTAVQHRAAVDAIASVDGRTLIDVVNAR